MYDKKDKELDKVYERQDMIYQNKDSKKLNCMPDETAAGKGRAELNHCWWEDNGKETSRWHPAEMSIYECK